MELTEEVDRGIGQLAPYSRVTIQRVSNGWLVYSGEFDPQNFSIPALVAKTPAELVAYVDEWVKPYKSRQVQ